MKYGVYCVRDRLVGYLAPQLEIADNVAIRNFAMAVNKASPDSLIGFNPKDFDLYKLGTFDSEKGSFDTIVPEFIVSGSGVVGVDYEKET